MSQTEIYPVNKMHPRMARERNTIEKMIRIYCRKLHGGQDKLCEECSELLAYAEKRLKACPFQEKKSTCGKCTVHCYKPQMRKKVREVMRFAGPRMIVHHPLLAISHTIDGRRKPPTIESIRKKDSTK